MIGYKVVRYFENRLVSAIIGLHQIEYQFGEEVKPKKHCGPLCVFSTLESAIEFVGKRNGMSFEFRIYESECEQSKEEMVYSMNLSRVYDLRELPENTVLVNSVKLLKRVA